MKDSLKFCEKQNLTLADQPYFDKLNILLLILDETKEKYFFQSNSSLYFFV